MSYNFLFYVIYNSDTKNQSKRGVFFHKQDSSEHMKDRFVASSAYNCRLCYFVPLSSNIPCILPLKPDCCRLTLQFYKKKLLRGLAFFNFSLYLLYGVGKSFRVNSLMNHS